MLAELSFGIVYISKNACMMWLKQCDSVDYMVAYLHREYMGNNNLVTKNMRIKSKEATEF